MAASINNCTFPQMAPQEICYINANNNYCRCSLFDFNQLKAISESINHPLSFCHKVIGFHSDGWENFQKFLIDVDTWKKKNFKNIPAK